MLLLLHRRFKDVWFQFELNVVDRRLAVRSLVHDALVDVVEEDLQTLPLVRLLNAALYLLEHLRRVLVLLGFGQPVLVALFVEARVLRLLLLNHCVLLSSI